MELSRRDFVRIVGASAAAAGLSTVLEGHVLAQGEAPVPTGREVLPIPDRPGAGPVALYAQDVTYAAGHALRPPEGAPNIVIILIDDMGFGATSAFGGPIHMPTLERVATNGLKYSRFHTTALCSPTRQAMLTGRNHHSVGMGSITETATTAPGYTSVRPNSAATIVETLRLNGYNTAAFGKMHQTPVWEVSTAGPFDRWPTGDGFEKFYGFVGAETNQWAPTLYDGTNPVQPPDDPDYHLTPDLVDHAIAWVQAQHTLTPDKPFFVYLSFGATHAPHHAPKEFSDRYAGKFDQGWDAVRETTLARQKELGVVPQDCQLTARSEGIRAWTELTDDEKKIAARLMEIYAGFAEHTDFHAGRFLDALQAIDVLENTLVFYIAGDNGASAEGLSSGSYNEMLTINYTEDSIENILAHYDDLGTIRAYNHYPVGWAHAMDCPYQWTKQVASHWGGTRNGMVVSWPEGIRARGEVRNQWHHVIDIAPTILECASLPEPIQVHGVTQKPMEGVSIAYSFEDGAAPDRHTTQYFEMFGNRGIYHQGWSAVTIHHSPFRKGKSSWDEDVWELYDNTTDWSQAVNLADQYPEKLAELQDLFMVEAAKYNVFPLDDRRTELTNPELAGRPDLLNGRTSMTFYPGMSQLMENTVPNIKNKSHTVTADIEVPAEGADGVLIAQGGRFGGWSLYVVDSVLKYTHNYLGIQEYRVSAAETLPAGRVTVQYRFDYEGGSETGAGGQGSLYIGDMKVGEAHIDRTVPFTFSLDETLDIGHDLATPVSSDYTIGDNDFTGKIYSVKVEVEEGALAYYEPAENIYNRLMAAQ